MAHQTEIFGELEIIWMSHALSRQIHVIAGSGVMKYGEDCQARTPLTVRYTKLGVMKYGEDCQARTPLTVRYTKLGKDVGHYDCLIHPDPAITFIIPWYRRCRRLPVRSTLNAVGTPEIQPLPEVTLEEQ